MTAPATSRAQHVVWQRNVACEEYDRDLRALRRYYLRGVFTVDEIIHLFAVASTLAADRLAELAEFASREQPSRLRSNRAVRQGLHQVGGGQP